ncbi:MAG: transketolase [candidate division Zixibacteria bacterium]|nr:transketolase [candidate division Zixibacteria bacterium]
MRFANEQDTRVKDFDPWRGFTSSALSPEWRKKLSETARRCRAQILKMTSLAASGHPGGSMSSLELYLTLYHMARVDPRNPMRDDRDRIIVSHGHTSPGAYTALAAAGFFDPAAAMHGFRQAGSPFEGHVERSVPGIEWDTGNLGQGLSVGIGKALYARLSGLNFHTFVIMGDGEQQKGQVGEARRVAAKFALSRLTAIIDRNRLQISGRTVDILPQDLAAEWEADGWQAVEIDGHSFDQIYGELHRAVTNEGRPIVIIANTVMGKDVGFMENDEAFHGAPVAPDMLTPALALLGDHGKDLPALRELRKQGPPPAFKIPRPPYPPVETGQPATYGADVKMDNRTAFGKALLAVADLNLPREDFVMAVFDCDLAGSVKTAAFGQKYPDNFFQCGITEHNTAAIAGSLSAERAVSIWADFAVFGVDETFNQARLNDINHANLKLFCTHTGVQVGEDGKTHQCIDYFALLNSTFGWRVITPADPNQTDRITRWVLSRPGNFAVFMGRSATPIIPDADGRPFFGGDYEYRYGRMDVLRRGERLALVAAGNMCAIALDAWQRLSREGVGISLISVADWSDFHADDLQMLAAHEHLVVLEDHNVKTGLGTALAAELFQAGARSTLTKMGVTAYASSGPPADLFRLLGLDPASVVARVKAILG